jgi:hypothetical protein
MSSLRAFAVLAVVLAMAPLAAWAQPASGANGYDPLKTFAPLTLPQPANTLRTGAGTPGPAYWQNRADYRIEARLDAPDKLLSGDETITYTNNSPDTLDALWLQLDQNLYRADSRGSAMGGGRPRRQFTDGYSIDAVEVEGAGRAVPAAHLISDTRMRVALAVPLKPGGQLKLHIRYHFTIPAAFGGRMAWGDSRYGQIFDLAQWYPRMAVYDDVRGWDTLPYLANEFYLEYGDFDYAVTVPADMLVTGSGQLVNPQEVLTPVERARLDAARASDRTVMIRTPAEVVAAVARPPLTDPTKTWRFHMDHSRDVAFSASRAFVWDAARINLPDGKSALAQSVYPVESAGEAAWGRSTEYLKDAVEHFSARWFPYPWPNAVNVAGPASGMEYPGLLFDGIGDKGAVLFWITAHEIGHTWFPMVVGFDERRDAWMDEGFNTFIDTYESEDFQGGVYGPKRDSEYAPGKGTPGEQIAALLADPDAPPILTRADAIREKYRHPITYFKSAYGLTLLREDILGPQRFDAAFRKFIADWAFKHPKPSDFFRAMESAGGEDLSWFWRGWYLHNWTHDLAVTSVKYVEGDPTQGAEVTVANLGQLVLPATLRVTYAGGKTADIGVPVETWMQNGSHIFAVPAGTILDVVIDPDRRLPDRDRSNNSAKP